jgi:hypothetical protein
VDVIGADGSDGKTCLRCLVKEKAMGKISIQTAGSFPTDSVSISAEEGGHAFAIQRAIEWLNRRLPDAIRSDHRLHEGGNHPPISPFGLTESQNEAGAGVSTNLEGGDGQG